MSEQYDIFISFPLTERKNTFKETVNTKDFYLGEKIYNVFTHLLGVKTFFSNVSLLNNNKNDFWEKISEVIPTTKVLVIVLSKEKDYYREYCQKERDLYLATHKDNAKIYFVVSNEVKRVINTFDIMQTSPQPELIAYEELLQMQKLYNFINNYFERNENGNEEEVKVCLNCEKIFYKNNDVDTVCIYHPKKDVKIKRDSEGYYAIYNCCNKITRLKNKNVLIPLSPGCIEKKQHNFK